VALLFAATLLMIWGKSLPLTLLAFALSGFGFGITYSASIFYSLNNATRAGRRAGIHEACNNIGSACVPFFGGYLVLAWASTSAPYALLALGTLWLFPVLGEMLRGSATPAEPADPPPR